MSKPADDYYLLLIRPMLTINDLSHPLAGAVHVIAETCGAAFGSRRAPKWGPVGRHMQDGGLPIAGRDE